MDDMAFYNSHYIRTDDRNRIVDGFSDGPHYGHTTEGYVCINDKGGYQFRLILDGVPTEENPPLFDWNGIPLYEYLDGAIKHRSEADIEADAAAIPPPPPSPLEQLRADVDFLSVMQGVEL